MQAALAGSKYYEAADKKIGVILLHAYTGTPNDMNFLARRLNEAGCNVLCPLFKGHGTDDVQDIFRATTDDWWQQTQEIISWAQGQSYQDLFIFGLSLGGMFATRALMEYQEVFTGGGVFNSPVMATSKIDVRATFMEYAQYVYKRAGKLDQFAADQAKIEAGYDQQVAQIEAFRRQALDLYIDYTKPFYICQSGSDELIDEQEAFDLKNELSNAQVSFHYFPDNTHVITVNKDREAFEASVVDFIDQYAATGLKK